MNILVTGANGFLGSSIINLLSNHGDFVFFKGTRDTINLYSYNSIEEYIDHNKIEAVIHCAIAGGSRLKRDGVDEFYQNLLMYENLIKFNNRYKVFINFASGAEYDRRYNITDVNEYNLFDNVPVDYYGLSKNVISKLSVHYSGSVSLRIFGCFYHNELPTRFIRNSLTHYSNGLPMVIHQDRYMDFIYLEDLISVVEYFLREDVLTFKDINMSYLKKYKLSDIANIINNLTSKKVEIIINDDINGLDYTGNGKFLNSLNIKMIGLEGGIERCYEKIK